MVVETHRKHAFCVLLPSVLESGLKKLTLFKIIYHSKVFKSRPEHQEQIMIRIQ